MADQSTATSLRELKDAVVRAAQAWHHSFERRGMHGIPDRVWARLENACFRLDQRTGK